MNRPGSAMRLLGSRPAQGLPLARRPTSWIGVSSAVRLLLRPSQRLLPTAAVKEATSLSDLMVFESELDRGTQPAWGEQQTSDPTLRAQELLSRASRVLAAAREITVDPEASPSGNLDVTRSVLRASLEGKAASPSAAWGSDPEAGPGARPPSGSSPASSGPGSGGGSGGAPASGEMPAWADALFGRSSGGALPSSNGPLLQRQEQRAEALPGLMFAEPQFGFLDLTSQADQDLEFSRSAELPPLQSVLELTSASRPPTRHMEAEVAVEAPSVSAPTRAGQMLKDGTGVLGDGTRWLKKSGEEFGPNGYWKRWTLLQGVAKDGSVSWEECWWEASDYQGLRELGAAKKGTAVDGSAWNEAWSEKMYHQEDTKERVVERTAHKWARDPAADEWEEQWGEKYSEKGPASKWADKWARQAENVWHERWGEDYDGYGGCVKYTDKWAERLREGAAPEQWGDKWTESFKDGKGSKHGEVWTADGNGGRYNRWWNEEHPGNGWVRKHGNSTGGEHWDSWEQMDTYYNPIPHFGYDLAVKHSPDLVNIPLVRPGYAKSKGKAAAAADAAAAGAGSTNGAAATGGGSGGAPPEEPPSDDGLGSGMDAL